MRAVLTDLDGVLRIWDAHNFARAEAASGLPAGALRAAAFAPDLLEPAITGRVSDGGWRERMPPASVQAWRGRPRPRGWRCAAASARQAG